jgi:hypothetical protein
MKMVKSLLLGSAAGLVAIAGAQAADLPVKAKPVQYVKICSLYGVGFYYIPGTDMCLKVGGWVRQEIGYGQEGSFTSPFFNNNLQNRSTNNLDWRYKGVITADARNQTPYGTVRGYAAIGTSNNNDSGGGTAVYAPRWFMQWAGFTFGHSVSFYDFYSIGANQYSFGSAAADTGDGGWDVIAYTAQFGNGLSATISAEQSRRTKINNNTTAGVSAPAVNPPAAWAVNGVGYEGFNSPDVVGNIRLEQAWGSLQLMAAWHNVGTTYYNSNNGGAAVITEPGGHPDNKSGFAIGGGIKLNAPMIGKGDYLQAETTYSEGANRYNNMTVFIGDYVMYNGKSIGYGIRTDAVTGGTLSTGTAAALELTTTWSVNAAYSHHWNDQWKTNVWGSYLATSYNTTANAMLCTTEGFGTGVGSTAVATPGCDNDWSLSAVGVLTNWNVTKDFYLGLEVMYANLNSASTPTGLIALLTNGTKPATGNTRYTVADQDIWSVRFRVHKDFYP